MIQRRSKLRFVRAAILIAGLLVGLSLPLVGHFLRLPGVRGLLWGMAIGVTTVLGSFLAQTWAFEKPTRTFFATVAVGFLLRLTVIAGSIYLLSRFPEVHLATAAVALVGCYATLTALEVRFFNALLAVHG